MSSRISTCWLSCRIPVDNAVEEKVFDMAYDIELEYGLVIGTIVYSREF